MALSEREVDGWLQDGSKDSIFWRAWLPLGDVQAVVVLVHGGLEHSGRYEHVGRALAAAETAVYAPDLHGHGRSPGRPGQIGRMATLVDDVDRTRRLAEARQPGLPVFLLGHSLGAMVVLEYLVGGQRSVAGAVLSGTGIDVSAIPRAQALVARGLSAVAPNLGLVRLDSSGISRDPEVVRSYDEDPLVFRGKAPVRTAAELLASATRVTSRLGTITAPLLVLHGEADSVAAPDGACLVHDTVGSGDKTLTVYDGLFHEIFNEPEQDKVIGDVVDWLRARR